jgi:hypothetical protein
VQEATTPLQDARFVDAADTPSKQAEAGSNATSPIEADWTASISARTDRLGWYRMEITLEDASGKAIPNRVETDYVVIRPGVLPELPAAPVDQLHGLNPDYSAWLGLGLERISVQESIPIVAASARRTGMRYFYQFNVPPGVTTSQGFADHVRAGISGRPRAGLRGSSHNN